MPTNSALEWFPGIEKAGLPVPRTLMVPYDHRAYCAAMEGEGDLDYPSLHAAIVTAAEAIGYPVFIRTDLASAKHHGPKAYRASNKDEIDHVLSATVEDNEVKFWLSHEGPKAFMVRGWLELVAPFKAFGHHPIAREWRLFVTDKELLCSHFYWPEAAIQFYSVDTRPGRWKIQRTAMERQSFPDDLVGMAIKAAAVQDGEEAWSVDFALDVDGKWWLIDMAVASSSWHPFDCQNKFGTEREGK